MAEITDAELDKWEKVWRDRWRINKKNYDPVLCLIAAYRESRAEVRRLRAEAKEREKMFYGRI